MNQRTYSTVTTRLQYAYLAVSRPPAECILSLHVNVYCFARISSHLVWSGVRSFVIAVWLLCFALLVLIWLPLRQSHIARSSRCGCALFSGTCSGTTASRSKSNHSFRFPIVFMISMALASFFVVDAAYPVLSLAGDLSSGGSSSNLQWPVIFGSSMWYVTNISSSTFALLGVCLVHTNKYCSCSTASIMAELRTFEPGLRRRDRSGSLCTTPL